MHIDHSLIKLSDDESFDFILRPLDPIYSYYKCVNCFTIFEDRDGIKLGINKNIGFLGRYNNNYKLSCNEVIIKQIIE